MLLIAEVARNLTTKSNLPLTVGHYLKNMPLLADKLCTSNYKEPDCQRIYLKDIDCPAQWHDRLKQTIPPSLFYLNEAPTDFQGPGAAFATPSHETETDTKIQVARAGDLMSSLSPSMRAENLMCYIGHEGTYTPCHQEMCASLGHNIMVEASDGSFEYDMPTKPGSSIWFMTETRDRLAVSDYWTSTLGHNIDIEDHFAQINAWKAAPFKTYVVEQRPGDFILIPPLAAHQVWNRGTRTMKVAWNRTTAETLEMALKEALPRARMVCRDEQYKNKAIVFNSLERYSKLLNHVDTAKARDSKVQQLLTDFGLLFSLYTRILLSESFSQDVKEEDIEFVSFDSSITCSYCRCNIFNRFLTCPWCVEAPGSDDENAYDICMECYIMGRSCACISRLKWAEQFRWSQLTEKHEIWRQQIIQLSSDRDLRDAYPTLSVEKYRRQTKTLAEICQEQLRMRPWTDITKPVQNIDASDSEDAGPVRKRKKLGKADKDDSNAPCHVCKWRDPLWKLASCTSCNQKYCYGSLFRAFNIHPQEIMEQYEWKCPKCRHICNCGGCRRDPKMRPFEPAYILGHDTKKIADPRSTEVLVDFRHSNLRWLQRIGDEEVARVKRTKPEPEEMRTQHLNDYSVILEESTLTNGYSDGYDNIPVDPALEQLDSSILTSPDSTELQNIARYALG